MGLKSWMMGVLFVRRENTGLFSSGERGLQLHRVKAVNKCESKVGRPWARSRYRTVSEEKYARTGRTE
jgi:hypothetical protein